MDADFQEKEGGAGAFPPPSLSLLQYLAEEDTLSISESPSQHNHHHGSFPESYSSGLGSFLWSSSGCSTPLESDLGSTEVERDEADFIAELTRQMANTTLQDEDDDEKSIPDSPSDNNQASNCSDSNSNYTSHDDQTVASVPSHDKSPEIGIYSNQAFNYDQELGQIQYYQPQIQPSVKEEVSGCWGRSGGGGTKTTRSSKQAKPDSQREKQHNKKHRQMTSKEKASRFSLGGRARPFPIAPDTRVVLLGGSGIKTGSSGTGVFLPQGTNSSTKPPKKSGCSTVLVPTRVLQILNLHFNNMDAQWQSNGCGGGGGGGTSTSAYPFWPTQYVGFALNSQQKQYSESQVESSTSQQDLNLPEEWTYE